MWQKSFRDIFSIQSILFTGGLYDFFFQVGNILPVSYAGETHTLSPDDLPKVVATTLPQGSPVTSMEFHPVQQILLLGMSYKTVLSNVQIL